MEQPPQQAGRILAVGLAMTTAMWVFAFIAFMQVGLALGEVLFGLTLLTLVAGGWVLGATGGTWITGVGAGLVSASINMLLIGTVVSGNENAGQLAGVALAWVAGTYAVSAVLCGIGAMFGRVTSPKTPVIHVNWRCVLGNVIFVMVFFMLIVGGLVTGLQVGMAVPDWPNTFGHNMLLYPLSEMTEGVYFEHAHRLYGMLVGLTAIIFFFAVMRFDRRIWLTLMAGLFVLVLIIQGILGGTRVTEDSLALAAVHGVFGQVVFAFAALFGVFMHARWKDTPRQQSSGTGMWLGVWLVVSVLAQIAIGSAYRHYKWPMGLEAPGLNGLLHIHILVAVLVILLVIVTSGWSITQNRDEPVVRRAGVILLCILVLQILLGVLALIAVLRSGVDAAMSPGTVAITTAHQATGGLLLAFSARLCAWLWRRRLPSTQLGATQSEVVPAGS